MHRNVQDSEWSDSIDMEIWQTATFKQRRKRMQIYMCWEAAKFAHLFSDEDREDQLPKQIPALAILWKSRSRELIIIHYYLFYKEILLLISPLFS